MKIVQEIASCEHRQYSTPSKITGRLIIISGGVFVVPATERAKLEALALRYGLNAV
jgi:hypothetical protein